MKKLLMVLLLAGFAITYTPVEAKHDEMDFSDGFSEADQAELEKLIAELEQEAGTMPAGEEMEKTADDEEEVDHVEW